MFPQEMWFLTVLPSVIQLFHFHRTRGENLTVLLIYIYIACFNGIGEFRFVEFLHSAIEPQRTELLPIIYPVIVHMFLELTCNGHNTTGLSHKKIGVFCL